MCHVRNNMALQNEKNSRYLLRDGNQKIRPSGKIKESTLHEETLDISQLSTSCLLCLDAI